MRRTLFFLTMTLAAAGVSIAACNGDDDVTPSPTPAADSGNTRDTSTPTIDTGTGGQDAGTDTHVADSNVPDTNVPDTNVPDTNVPDTNVPDTNVPDTNVPDTNVPDTNVAETSAPDDGGDASTTPLCDPDAGAVVPEPWSFAVSQATLNGGKGQVITVNRCDWVQWENMDTAPHSVVGTSTFTFATAKNSGGKYAPIQFTTAGTFTYDCGVHGKMMIGEITVTP